MCMAFKTKLYQSLLNKPIQFYEKEKVGDLVNRLSNDVNEYKSSLKKYLSITIKSTCQCLGTIFSMYQISPYMTYGVVVIVPSLVVIGSIMATGLRKLSKDCQEKLASLVNQSNEVLNNIRTVKSFVAEDFELEKYGEKSEKYSDTCTHLGIGISAFQALSNLTLNALVLLTVAYGGSCLIALPTTSAQPLFTSQMTAGDLMSFLMGVQAIQKCLGQLSTLADKVSKYKTSRDRIMEHLDYSNLIQDMNIFEDSHTNPLQQFFDVVTVPFLNSVYYGMPTLSLQSISFPPKTGLNEFKSTKFQPNSYNDYSNENSSGMIIPKHAFRGEIRFENVSFAYPSRPTTPVLENFNISIKPGQVIAICGHNGSGKTTLVYLLERFYEPTSGRITIDGIDIRELDCKWLRKNVISVIDQDPVLFSGRVIDNITYGKPNATENEIREVIQITKIDEFIPYEELITSHGEARTLSERGKNLSGGQKQRINIARAILKKAPIVILDEATSSMDGESESKIKQALDAYLPGHTVISISHRLNTVTRADCIIVMSKGQIVEQGTHAELCRNKGMYWELIKHSLTPNPAEGH